MDWLTITFSAYAVVTALFIMRLECQRRREQGKPCGCPWCGGRHD